MKTDPFSPVAIGPLAAKNHLMRSATNDHLGNRDATVSDAQIDMYDILASNETGTIITGHISIDPDPARRADIVQLGIGDDSFIAGLSRIPAKIHEYGALAVAQISHAGRRALDPVDFNKLSTDEMSDIVAMFVEGAVRAKSAGFDAVEVHAAHWYMLAGVLNADLNRRTDRYGGDNAGRILMVREIVEGIRRECGPDFGIFVKINAHNTLEGVDDYGILTDYAHTLRDAGIDLLDISGMSFTKQPRAAECYFIDAARAVREALPDMKLALVGGIFSRETIDKALTVADIAAMGRTLLTQPDFVKKLKNGKADTSRCIRCNKCFELYKTKYERCIFGPVNPKLVETFGSKNQFGDK